MLCGLPVVSTPSLGGRDVFFDDRFCVIAEDNAEAVAAAVRDLADRDVDPYLVRNSTLEKLTAHRSRFRHFVTELQLAANAQPTFERDWARYRMHPICLRHGPIGELRAEREDLVGKETRSGAAALGAGDYE